jgi:1L-myo-inositol 1-phosphate cytidylyltransferase
MTDISEAVVLMAGSGSRLRGEDDAFLKPMTPILGRPLIDYILAALIHAGIRKIHFIVGYESARMIAAVGPLVPTELEFSFIENPEWKKQNGISLLAAAKHLGTPFVLTMSDHLFDHAIVDLITRDSEADKLNLAIDRKIASIFDLGDAMKVQTRVNKVTAIGKDLRDYDAIDTGLFVCPPEIFQYLERAKRNNDCSLADGVRLMASDGKVRAVDIGDAWWQDVDTPSMLQNAENTLRISNRAKSGSALLASRNRHI